MKRIIALLLSVTMLVTLASCSEKSKGATFTVGFDKEMPPMGFVADDGSYVGFDLDLAKEVAKRLGMEIVYQPIDWAAKDMELDSGNIDCIWNGFTISKERETEYEWTSPYMNNNQIVVVTGDSKYASFADLKGKIIAVQDDSSALDAIEANADLKANVGKIVKTDTNLNALMELEAGSVDAVVMDECVARYNIEKQGADYKILDEIVGSEKYGVGFKLGNASLRDDVESTLKDMAKDGTLAKISTDWFGKDITIIGK